jgi:hypothetical protein
VIESLEERRTRLRATRDRLAKPKLEEEVKEHLNTRSKEEQERLQRCLKVLKEAADEVFKRP